MKILFTIITGLCCLSAFSQERSTADKTKTVNSNYTKVRETEVLQSDTVIEEISSLKSKEIFETQTTKQPANSTEQIEDKAQKMSTNAKYSK